mmetsp:Transcript_29558/g.84919  ORF Transcript_29558/g.84919 Transcript_29558/m.84919 type:complete len:294 (+) Transcript_29558:630-1511(+)
MLPPPVELHELEGPARRIGRGLGEGHGHLGLPAPVLVEEPQEGGHAVLSQQLLCALLELHLAVDPQARGRAVLVGHEHLHDIHRYEPVLRAPVVLGAHSCQQPLVRREDPPRGRARLLACCIVADVSQGIVLILLVVPAGFRHGDSHPHGVRVPLVVDAVVVAQGERINFALAARGQRVAGGRLGHPPPASEELPSNLHIAELLCEVLAPFAWSLADSPDAGIWHKAEHDGVLIERTEGSILIERNSFRPAANTPEEQRLRRPRIKKPRLPALQLRAHVTLVPIQVAKPKRDV